jgi:hypothetical protein
MTGSRLPVAERFIDLNPPSNFSMRNTKGGFRAIPGARGLDNSIDKNTNRELDLRHFASCGAYWGSCFYGMLRYH